MNKFVVAAIALAYLVTFGLIGSDDMQEEIDRGKEYCSMVQAGAWGAYDKSINCSEMQK